MNDVIMIFTLKNERIRRARKLFRALPIFVWCVWPGKSNSREIEKEILQSDYSKVKDSKQTTRLDTDRPRAAIELAQVAVNFEM